MSHILKKKEKKMMMKAKMMMMMNLKVSFFTKIKYLNIVFYWKMIP